MDLRIKGVVEHLDLSVKNSGRRARDEGDWSAIMDRERLHTENG